MSEQKCPIQNKCPYLKNLDTTDMKCPMNNITKCPITAESKCPMSTESKCPMNKCPHMKSLKAEDIKKCPHLKDLKCLNK